jgi:hypothetical protein
MNKKIAQRTTLDHFTDKNQHHENRDSKQLDLAIIDRDMEAWKNETFKNDSEKFRAKPQTNYTKIKPFIEPAPYKPLSATERRELDDAAIKKVQDARDKINLDFPVLAPDQIKYRNLTEEEVAEYKNTSYPSSKILQLNNSINPEAKTEIIAVYNSLREVAAKFKADYEEANQLSSADNSLDYSGTYIDLMKRMPEFIVRVSRIEVGKLFGDVQDKSGDAINIARFLEKGINIFNITPLNYQSKINEMKSVIPYMQNIMEAYAKRKKLLSKLPKEVEASNAEYLRKREVRDFFKWLEDYFPNNKKEFFMTSLQKLIIKILISLMLDH